MADADILERPLFLSVGMQLAERSGVMDVQEAAEARQVLWRPGGRQRASALTLRGLAASLGLTLALWGSGRPWDAIMQLGGLCHRPPPETL